MAPLGISLVNLLIESSSVSCLAEERRGKKEFAGNSSFFSTNIGNNNNAAALSSSSTTAVNGGSYSPSFSSSSFEKANFNNNNNYFSGKSGTSSSSDERSFVVGEAGTGSPSSTQSPKLYSQFWEKFKKSCDSLAPHLSQSANSSSSGSPTGFGEGGSSSNDFFEKEAAKSTKVGEGRRVHFKTEPAEVFYGEGEQVSSSFDKKTAATEAAASSPIYKKFYEKVLPLYCSSILTYPSDLHYYGRVAVMSVVTGYVIEKTLESLPDIEQLGRELGLGPLLQCNLLDGTDPNQPGRVGLDKDFF